jgi:DNA polymerase-3 subunit gamma/tau
VQQAAPTPAPAPRTRSWPEFLAYLRQASPATAANLEHGNLLHDFDATAKPLSITVAFPQAAAVFKDYLDDRDTYARLKGHLADFFELSVDEINFRSSLLTEEEKQDKNFRTQVEIADEERRRAQEELRQKILNDPYVKEAEKLFNSKVDKIVLKDQES